MLTIKKYIYIIVLMILNLVTTHSAYSQDLSAFCSLKDTAIYFGNGVDTPRGKAKRHQLLLEDKVRGVMSDEEFNKIEFELAYNNTGGLIYDLMESAIQDLATDYTYFWRMLAHNVPMSESFKEKLLELSTAVDESALLLNQDLSIHVNNYKNSILEGKKVILVSHSQGNFFGNQAYGNLSFVEKESFGIVSVANPDSFVAGSGPYTTLFEDLVILAITVAKTDLGLPTPLLPNETNFLTLDDLSGHGFDSAYLQATSNSESKILNDIVNLRGNLAPPQNTASQGIITVTLTWGSQPDVDLHVFEPSGWHVYYANRAGLSGYLDVDVVSGFGPEHYYVSCDTLQTGNYQIGVNYYSGYAPEVAQVNIQAGLELRSYEVFLPSALGSSGDASPIPVGTIAVTEDDQGTFTFEIR